jgi:hypothetical protein
MPESGTHGTQSIGTAHTAVLDLPDEGVGLERLVYLIAGVLVAATHHYFRNLHSLRLIASAVLAIVLWPLVLLGVDLHIHP